MPYRNGGRIVIVGNWNAGANSSAKAYRESRFLARAPDKTFVLGNLSRITTTCCGRKLKNTQVVRFLTVTHAGRGIYGRRSEIASGRIFHFAGRTMSVTFVRWEEVVKAGPKRLWHFHPPYGVPAPNISTFQVQLGALNLRGFRIRHGDRMFRGSHITRVDEKGRLKLPAEFKRQIDAEYGADPFYITSRDGKTAEIHPMREWEEYEKKLAAMPSSHPAKQKLLMRFNYFGQKAEMDGQGRVLLPQVLREKANLIAEVVVHGSEDVPEGFEPRAVRAGSGEQPDHCGRQDRDSRSTGCKQGKTPQGEHMTEAMQACAGSFTNCDPNAECAPGRRRGRRDARPCRPRERDCSAAGAGGYADRLRPGSAGDGAGETEARSAARGTGSGDAAGGAARCGVFAGQRSAGRARRSMGCWRILASARCSSIRRTEDSVFRRRATWICG